MSERIFGIPVHWTDVAPCGQCGAMVANEQRDQHTRWHEQVAVLLARAVIAAEETK